MYDKISGCKATVVLGQTNGVVTNLLVLEVLGTG